MQYKHCLVCILNSWMLMLISLFHHIIICLIPVFFIYFRILFSLIPYTSQATAVLSARVLEAAGCHSPQSASTGLSWHCNDGEGARHRHIRGQHCIPQIPRSSWSLLVFGGETWLVIVAFILPVLIGSTTSRAQTCTHHVIESVIHIGVFQLFWLCDPLKEQCVGFSRINRMYYS